MGWVTLALIGVSAFGLLWALGVPRSLWAFTGAALMFGAAGYALQQNANLPGHPVQADTKVVDLDPGMIAFRNAIMPTAAGDPAILEADNRLRAGNSQAAAQLLIDALKTRPNDAALWTALGSALSTHSDGQVSPAALFAFRRAVDLAPNEPGPPFFLGMAYIQAGDLQVAKQAWIEALRRSPNNAPYRADIAERLVLIDQFSKMQAAQAKP